MNSRSVSPNTGWRAEHPRRGPALGDELAAEEERDFRRQSEPYLNRIGRSANNASVGPEIWHHGGGRRPRNRINPGASSVRSGVQGKLLHRALLEDRALAAAGGDKSRFLPPPQLRAAHDAMYLGSDAEQLSDFEDALSERGIGPYQGI